ncbi:unnamed protein product [Schistosoma curassoni]|nr:unnamed protein product [Schistosoma curassoni]
MQNNNRQLDKIAKRRAADTKYPRLFGCSRSTYYRRLRKLKAQFIKKCWLPSCDEETDNPVVVTESRTTVATEQWANIVTDTATASCSYVQCSDNTISGSICLIIKNL